MIVLLKNSQTRKTKTLHISINNLGNKNYWVDPTMIWWEQNLDRHNLRKLK